MAEFNTFDLGRVIQTAEAIKGLKRQSSLDALQERYLGQRIQAGEQEMARNQRAEQTVLGKEKAQQVVAKTGFILQAPNPKNYVEQNEPDLIKALAAQGVDWATADDEVVRQMATAMQHKAKTELGQAPAAPVSAQAVGGFQTLQQDGKVIASAAPAKPDVITPYQQERLNLERERLQRERGGESKPPAGYRWKPDGSLEAIPGGPATVETKTGNITEGERKAAALGTRLDAALTSLNGITKAAPNAVKPGLLERGLEGMGMETAANYARSSDRQQADAAQLDALDAALTLATGAAYTKDQLQNLRKAYFPQIGDSDETVRTKSARFETIVKTARIAAGRAEPSIDRANRGATGSWGEPGQATQIGGFTVRRVK